MQYSSQKQHVLWRTNGENLQFYTGRVVLLFTDGFTVSSNHTFNLYLYL